MAPPSPRAQGRREPVQERSRQRREAILDAAAQAFADIGFEAATMEGIAARASTSIGSVYQFFPHKQALFEAVADRCLERSRAAFDRLLSAVPPGVPWPALVDGAIDAFAALHDRDPAFRATVVNFSLYGLYEARDSELDRYFVRRVSELLAARAPRLSAQRLRIVATTVVQLVSTMMFAAERSRPPVRARLREELKLAVRRYLAPELERTPRG